jgi:heme-degrading monooxygenase HmoA
MAAYTVGVWTVKRGREEDFVNAWHALAQWTIEQGFDSHGTLLRDHDDPSRFVSLGPWPSADAAQRWRDDPGFGDHLDEIMKLVERFEPATYDIVLSVS